MTVARDSFTQLIDKAVEDPVFAQRLVDDPGATAGAEGLELPTEVVDNLKGATGNDHPQLVENLHARMSRMLTYLH